MEKVKLSEIIDAAEGKLCYGDENNIDSIYVTSVSSSSNDIEEGALFVPIIGERVNAHKFIKQAFEAGAIVSLASDDVAETEVPEGKYVIHVDDTLKAIQKVAAWYRRKFDIPVVGVTGSVGKTTTKEMLATALSAKYNVLKTAGNKNSQLGVALMMFEINSGYDIAVIEMGISEHGEMNPLTWMASPVAAVVTNIGVSHIAQLGSRENIRDEKLCIVNGFPDEGGELFLCGNDELLSKVSKDSLSVKWFGSAGGCDYKAYNIVNNDNGTAFDIKLTNGNIQHVQLGVLGLHNVHNAAAAIAIAEKFGVDIQAAVKKLGEYKPIAMRGQIFEKNGIKIIDDTYNASPDSMKSGLSVLWDMKCSGKRYAVLADVLELGSQSENLHRSVGKYIVEKYNEGMKTDVLITVGKEASYIAEEAKAVNNIDVMSFDNRDMATEYLKGNLRDGDLVIFKGSRGMKMDEIVKAILE